MGEQINVKYIPDIEPKETITRLAHMSSVPQLLSFVCCYAGEKGFPEKRINEIEVALNEAISYLIFHAHKENPGEIQIGVSMDIYGKLAIIVTDTGMPCNLLLGNSPFFEGDISLLKERTRVVIVLQVVSYF